MEIIPSKGNDYAHLKWDKEGQEQIRELQVMILRSLGGVLPFRGLRIEVSESDLIPEDVRRSLADGRFFVVE